MTELLGCHCCYRFLWLTRPRIRLLLPGWKACLSPFDPGSISFGKSSLLVVVNAGVAILGMGYLFFLGNSSGCKSSDRYKARSRGYQVPPHVCLSSCLVTLLFPRTCLINSVALLIPSAVLIYLTSLLILVLDYPSRTDLPPRAFGLYKPCNYQKLGPKPDLVQS